MRRMEMTRIVEPRSIAIRIVIGNLRLNYQIELEAPIPCHHDVSTREVVACGDDRHMGQTSTAKNNRTS